MNTYYAAGIPYSDELWHYGTKGMKWGQRLYQYEDGSLTPLGKIHYANKKLGAHAVQTIKRRHTWMMSDEEIERDLKRLRKEKELKDAYQAVKGKSVSKRILEKTGDVVYSTAKKAGENFGQTIGQKTADRIVSKLIESDSQKRARELREEAELIEQKIHYKKAKQGAKNFSADQEISRLERDKKKADRTKEYLVSKKALKDYRESTSKAKSETKTKQEPKPKTEKKEKTSSSAKVISSFLNNVRAQASNKTKSKQNVKSRASKVGWGSTSASSASSSQKAEKGKEWTKKSNALEADYVYDSWAGYQRSKDGTIKGW